MSGTVSITFQAGVRLEAAAALAIQVLSEYSHRLDALRLVPAAADVFNVHLDDQLLFASSEAGRPPVYPEVRDLLAGWLGPPDVSDGPA
ncbi:MAG: hypothetical protein GEU28_04780 [Dehalococcoidia bacterium]|nr:hypothetical protein [Dehalococcoidia bacterium]